MRNLFCGEKAWYTEGGKSEVVNLELEVLKMKIIIIFIDLLMATVLFFVGRFFIKSRNTERSVLFLSGDYTGLNTEKICRVIPFCELPDIIIDKVAIWDTYKTDYTTFNICGHDIYVYDDELAKVIKQLSDRYRENVLMYYFLDMSDTEIAKLQNISRSGVFQNRHYALKQMKKSLEEEN